MNRRSFLAGCSGLAITGLAGCTEYIRGDDEPEYSPASEGEPVGVTTVVGGMSFPSDIDTSIENRWFITDLPGRIYIYDTEDSDLIEAIDIIDRIPDDGEVGMLSVALHPNFEENHRLFARYSLNEVPDDRYHHTAVLAEFEVSDEFDEIIKDSERRLIELPQRSQNHQGGHTKFGPDGYLYTTLGDDQHNVNMEDAPPWVNSIKTSQDVTDLRGSILRLDINNQGEELEYGIPDDNPLINENGRDEIFAWGFRNPWQLSFHDETLFVGDVGTYIWEIIHVVEKGENYAWGIKEGTHCHDNVDLRSYARDNPSALINPSFLSDAYSSWRYDCVNWTNDDIHEPEVQYPHTSQEEPIHGGAVALGEMYTNSTVEALEGRFVWVDQRSTGDVGIFSTDPTQSADPFWSIQTHQFKFDTDYFRAQSLRKSPDGELLMSIRYSDDDDSDGQILQVTPE